MEGFIVKHLNQFFFVCLFIKKSINASCYFPPSFSEFNVLNIFFCCSTLLGFLARTATNEMFKKNCLISAKIFSLASRQHALLFLIIILIYLSLRTFMCTHTVCVIFFLSFLQFLIMQQFFFYFFTLPAGRKKESIYTHIHSANSTN